MTSSLKNILVINQYFSPDLASTGQYATEICRGLVSNGRRLKVITAQPCYSKKSPEAPTQEGNEGLLITRIPMGRFRGRENFKIRIIGYLYFLVKAKGRVKKFVKEEKVDLVITFHNPPLVALLGSSIAKKNNIPFIYVLYDVHPDVLLSSGWKLPSGLIWVWEKLNKKIFERAKKIIVLSNGMKESLVKGKNVSPDKIEVIPIWGRPELLELEKDRSFRQELGIEKDAFIFLYAGNLGVMHPLEVIVDAAKELNDLPLKIIFVGDGAKRQSLQEKVLREGVKNVKFLPFQPEDKFIKILASADCCFVTLGRGLENLALPSRAFTFLSAGKPIISIMDKKADLARLLEKNRCGWVAETIEQLSSLMRNLVKKREEIAEFGHNARHFYAQNYKKEKIIKRYIDIVDECLAPQ